MLLNKVVKLDIPHEPGEWVELRVLSWIQLEAARKGRLKEVMQTARELGPELFNELAVAPRPENTTPRNPLDEYDQLELLIRSIVHWSYKDKPSKSTIEELDSKTALWLLEAIAEYSLPRPDAELKN